jgi:hypothetical protein
LAAASHRLLDPRHGLACDIFAKLLGNKENPEQVR